MHGNQVLSNSLQWVWNGLAYANSCIKQSIKFAAGASYSAYTYINRILNTEQIQTQEEEDQARKALSATEKTIAEGISYTVKLIAGVAVISYGASWPVIGFITFGLLPRKMIVACGTTLFGSYFPTAIYLQQIAGNGFSLLNGFIPTSWIQLGCKKGVDGAIKWSGSKQLSCLYRNYHVGERIWLWSGAIISIHYDLKLARQEFSRIQTIEYHQENVKGTLIETSQCSTKWLFWEECQLRERKIIEQNLVNNIQRSGIVKSQDGGKNWIPVFYEEVSNEKSYRALYENGIIASQSTILHLSAHPQTELEIIPDAPFSLEITQTVFFLAVAALTKQLQLPTWRNNVPGTSKYIACLLLNLVPHLKIAKGGNNPHQQQFDLAPKKRTLN